MYIDVPMTQDRYSGDSRYSRLPFVLSSHLLISLIIFGAFLESNFPRIHPLIVAFRPLVHANFGSVHGHADDIGLLQTLISFSLFHNSNMDMEKENIREHSNSLTPKDSCIPNCMVVDRNRHSSTTIVTTQKTNELSYGY